MPLIIPDSTCEDQVCGSSHCLSTPYWYQKKSIPVGEEVLATQLSERGGELHLVWEEDGKLKLSGETTIFATGEIQLDSIE